MDDIFDSSLNLEEIHFKEGYDEGYKHGLIAGKEEAKQVGLKVGFESARSLGSIGAVSTFGILLSGLTQIAFRRGPKLEELIQKYPLKFASARNHG